MDQSVDGGESYYKRGSQGFLGQIKKLGFLSVLFSVWKNALGELCKGDFCDQIYVLFFLRFLKIILLCYVSHHTVQH